MQALLDLVSWAAILTGGAFIVIGAVGVLRMPDFFTRQHAAGLTDTLGAGLLLFGLMIQGGLTLVTVKLVLILLFLGLTSPTSSHALAQAALSTGVKPLLADDGGDDDEQDRET